MEFVSICRFIRLKFNEHHIPITDATGKHKISTRLDLVTIERGILIASANGIIILYGQIGSDNFEIYEESVNE